MYACVVLQGVCCGILFFSCYSGYFLSTHLPLLFPHLLLLSVCLSGLLVPAAAERHTCSAWVSSSASTWPWSLHFPPVSPRPLQWSTHLQVPAWLSPCHPTSSTSATCRHSGDTITRASAYGTVSLRPLHRLNRLSEPEPEQFSPPFYQSIYNKFTHTFCCELDKLKLPVRSA